MSLIDPFYRFGGIPLEVLPNDAKRRLRRPRGWFMQWKKDRQPPREHQMPGYKGIRVIEPIAEGMIGAWKRLNRMPHQGAKECARRVRQMTPRNAQ